MTLESTNNKNRYIGNGSTRSFAYTFKVWKKSEVAVWIGDGATEQEVSSSCSISITSSGGTVTFPTAPARGTIIVLRRSMPYIQEDDYRNGSRFDSEDVEDRFDQDCAERQDLRLDVGRAVKVPNTSDVSADDVVQALLNAIALMREMGDVTGSSLVKPDGGSVYRALSRILGDLVNVKDYGAKGNGTDDDTAAWTSWQSALSVGGLGYIPAGTYIVNGTALHFAHGCLGNGIDWAMIGNPAPDLRVFRHPISTTGPILRHHQEFSGSTSWASLLDLSFNSVCENGFSFSDWNTNGCGAYGITVRGRNAGSGSANSLGIKSIMLNEVNGDGDCVAVSASTYRQDPSGGTNLSDSCAVHAETHNNSLSNGFVMALEGWSIPGVNADPTGQYSILGPRDQMSVACYLSCRSEAGMSHSGLIIGGGTYGMWNAITLARSCWGVGSSGGNGVPNTVGINCGGWSAEHGHPSQGLRFGYCPKHVYMVGTQPFNISGNEVRMTNDNTAAGFNLWINAKQINSASGYLSRLLIAMDDDIAFDLFAEKGNENIFYRHRVADGGSHLFSSRDPEGTAQFRMGIDYEAVYPPAGGMALGKDNKRWTNVYAETSSISDSDERIKDNIAEPSDALMRAWGRVKFNVYQFKAAIAEKGEAARIHVGVIAQRVREAFAAEGLDARRYGLFCYDEWPARPAIVTKDKIVDAEAVYNEDGEVIQEEVWHWEETVESPAVEAGGKYSIRYEEALALECAYQRWRLEQIEARLASLEVQ